MAEDRPYVIAKWAAQEFLVNAGSEARKRFFAEIEKFQQRDVDFCFGGKNVDVDSRVDFSNDEYACGELHVYAWTRENGTIFYVGRGKADRVFNEQNRPEEFKSVVKSSKCKVHLIASFVNKGIVAELESICIQHALVCGCKLLNRSKSLTESEVLYFLARERGEAYSVPSETEMKYDDYVYLKERWPQICETIGQIISQSFVAHTA